MHSVWFFHVVVCLSVSRCRQIYFLLFSFMPHTRAKKLNPQWNIGSDDFTLVHRNGIKKHRLLFFLDRNILFEVWDFLESALWNCNYFFVWLRTSTFEMPNAMRHAIEYDENFPIQENCNRIQPVNRTATRKRTNQTNKQTHEWNAIEKSQVFAATRPNPLNVCARNANSNRNKMLFVNNPWQKSQQ